MADKILTLLREFVDIRPWEYVVDEYGECDETEIECNYCKFKVDLDFRRDDYKKQMIPSNHEATCLWRRAKETIQEHQLNDE
jgi:hypothetical protein